MHHPQMSQLDLEDKDTQDVSQYIGELLLELGLIQTQELNDAMEVQAQTGELIGQILMERGVISQEQLIEVLEQQLHRHLEHAGVHHRQLGEILLSLHAVSRWQLSQALELQSQRPEKIGHLLVELGYTSRGKVEQALSNQVVGDCHSVCCRHRRSLGELLLQSNLVTPEQLKQALMVQKQSHEYLGEILIRQGILTEEELEDLLAAQMILAYQDAEHTEHTEHSQLHVSKPLQPVQRRLGEILVDTHQLTSAQLQAAVEQQSNESHRRLGEILLEKGLVPLKELLRALRLQQRLATLAMSTFTGFVLLTSCGTPMVPDQTPFQDLYQVQQSQMMQVGRAHNVREGAFRTLQVDNGAQLEIYENGSRVIKDVPFFHQGNDNTCGQAVMTSLLNYWGDNISYQEVVNEANPHNMPTTDSAITNYMREKGFDAQPFRHANVNNLIAQVNKGRPTPVLLDFGGVSQEHYVLVVGYNPQRNTIVVHDSLEGPYVEMPTQTFTTMWENQALQLVHVFGGDNYRRIYFDVFKG